MKDRIVQQPGRVKITPANGDSESIVFIERADTVIQEGTMLNKANLLSDATANALGLTVNPETGFPTPNDAFSRCADLFQSNNDVHNEICRKEAVLLNNSYNDDFGILHGCVVAANGTSTLQIGSGEIMLKGHVISVNSIISINTSIYTPYTYLQVVIGIGSDFVTILESNAASSLSGLTTSLASDDINHSGSTYKRELCVVKLDEFGYATEVIRQMKLLPSIATRLPHVITNTTVQPELFENSDTYVGFGYTAFIPINGVTPNTFCDVIFSLPHAQSGNYSTVCQSETGGVRIWARAVPENAIVIPTIKIEVIA